MSHPINAVLVDNVAADKDDVRDYIAAKTVLVIATASEILGYELPDTLSVVLNGNLYNYDAADTTSAHDEAAGVLTDATPTTPRRYKRTVALPKGIVFLPSNVTNNNGSANTIADVTGLSFPVIAGLKYKFRFWIQYNAAAATTGSRWSINGPATTELSYRSLYSLTAATLTENHLSAYNLPAASNATSMTNGNIAIIEGIIQPSADGDVIARFASEVSSSGITAVAGASFVEYEAIA